MNGILSNRETSADHSWMGVIDLTPIQRVGRASTVRRL